MTQRIADLRFPDAWSCVLIAALLGSLTKKNIFVSRKAANKDRISSYYYLSRLPLRTRGQE